MVWDLASLFSEIGRGFSLKDVQHLRRLTMVQYLDASDIDNKSLVQC